jgi:lipopolysaccharide biosynthesis glycosyltransferase
MVNYRKIIFYDLLEIYDRILYLDSDIVINKNCPNIFWVVPYDTVGLVFEDKGSRLENRRARIMRIKNIYGGNEDWTSGLLNSGVLVVSHPHKEIFTKIKGKLWGQDFEAKGKNQTHFSYQLMKQGHKYIDLGYKWNHMSMFSEPWNGSASRFDSYIIHYAGGARFPDLGNRTRSELMRDDIARIYGDIKFNKEISCE